MPPQAVKTLRDLIFWQYAKIIAGSAGMGKKRFGFVMSKFKQLQHGEIFWNEIREYIKEREKMDECIFCGARGNLTIEHLIPRSLGGPDDEKNLIWICKRCNLKKGRNRLYEGWTKIWGLESAKYNIPRIAEGKYLKLIYEILENNNMLDLTIGEIRRDICPVCDIKKLCVDQDTVGKLSPLCLDGAVIICLKR